MSQHDLGTLRNKLGALSKLMEKEMGQRRPKLQFQTVVGFELNNIASVNLADGVSV